MKITTVSLFEILGQHPHGFTELQPGVYHLNGTKKYVFAKSGDQGFLVERL